MNETIEKPHVSKREIEKAQKEFLRKKVRMASSWIEWLKFEKPLREKEPDYLEFLNRAVSRISQEISIVRNLEKRTIRWDEARNRVFTYEFLEHGSSRFHRNYDEIYKDVAKIASHNSWMTRLNNTGNYWILNEIKQELRKANNEPEPKVVIFRAPPTPLLSADEINRMLQLANDRFKEVEEGFLHDEPAPKTAEFDFLEEVDMQLKSAGKYHLKKPRRNWRKEY